jgi:hypothetical protein
MFNLLNIQKYYIIIKDNINNWLINMTAFKVSSGGFIGHPAPLTDDSSCRIIKLFKSCMSNLSALFDWIGQISGFFSKPIVNISSKDMKENAQSSEPIFPSKAADIPSYEEEMKHFYLDATTEDNQRTKMQMLIEKTKGKIPKDKIHMLDNNKFVRQLRLQMIHTPQLWMVATITPEGMGFVTKEQNEKVQDFLLIGFMAEAINGPIRKEKIAATFSQTNKEIAAQQPRTRNSSILQKLKAWSSRQSQAGA